MLQQDWPNYTIRFSRTGFNITYKYMTEVLIGKMYRYPEKVSNVRSIKKFPDLIFCKTIYSKYLCLIKNLRKINH